VLALPALRTPALLGPPGLVAEHVVAGAHLKA